MPGLEAVSTLHLPKKKEILSFFKFLQKKFSILTKRFLLIFVQLWWLYFAKTIIFQFYRRSNGTEFYPKYCSGMVKEEKLLYAQFKLLEIMFNLHT